MLAYEGGLEFPVDISVGPDERRKNGPGRIGQPRPSGYSERRRTLGSDRAASRAGRNVARAATSNIAVVGNEKATSLDAQMRPVFYLPWRQEASPGTAIVARTTSDPRPVMAALRSESRAMEPDILLLGVQTMEDIIASTPATFLRRYPLMILGVFASLALLLASIGIYGVMSLSVRERTSETGIRMALGAQASAVLSLVLRQGLALSALGVSLGLAIGLSSSRVLSRALFETPPTDPAVFGAASAILIPVAAIASWLPARRASRLLL